MVVHQFVLRRRLHCLPCPLPGGVGLAALALLTRLAGLPAGVQVSPGAPQRIATRSPSLTDAVRARAAGLIQRMDKEIDAAAKRALQALRGRSADIEVGASLNAASEKIFIGETAAKLGLVNVVGLPLATR